MDLQTAMEPRPGADEAMRFDCPVPPGGYRWWYLDGLSADGRHAITIIAFVGSVFSPYYHWARRRNPEAHCALNVALYGPGGRWAMTERHPSSVSRGPDIFRIGPSALSWYGEALEVEIDETAFPRLVPVRGRIRLTLRVSGRGPVRLAPERPHFWWPVAPLADIEVEMERPGLSWRGHGYLDTNWGDEPLEAGFVRWDWSRVRLGEHAAIFYGAELRGGGRRSLAFRYGAAGECALEMPPSVPLGRTLWRIRRKAFADRGSMPEETMRLEDAPFYSRSLVAGQILGQRASGFHESLDLDRFASPLVKLMLPFRMPRTFWKVPGRHGGAL